MLLLPFVSPATVDAAFAARKILTIDRTRVPGTANHTNFPVLVSLTALNLRSTANGGQVTSSQGHDILFRGEDATTCAPAASPCRLDHEIESYDPVTGTLVAWVRVPTLRYSGAGANTVIYLYYGDATVTCSQQNKTGVWDSSYREVLHLNSTGDHDDSTVNAFTAVANGTVTAGATGQVGRAVDLGGGATGLTPAYLNVSDGTFPTGTSFTFEAWVYFRTINASQYIGLVTKGRECLNFDGDPDPGPGFCTTPPCGDWVGLYKLPDGGGREVFSLEGDFGQVCNPGGLSDPRGAPANIATGTWYHVAGVFSNGSPGSRRLLVNGVQVASDTPANTCFDAAIPHYTRLGTDSNQDFLDGFLDEVRISFTARSNGWLQTGYNNQSAPGTFYLSVADDAVGAPYAITPTACPAVNPCAGGPGTCYLRSIGNTTAYSTGSGTCTATNGSTVVSCPGAGWQSANRGRGDRITIDATNYMVRSVDSETQLQLASPFTGATGVGNKSYTMSRQFSTPQAWENCISTGGAACTYFPVANGNLVTGNRSEIGIVYEDSAYTFGSLGTNLLEFNGATTDASHTITLTADGANRHYGVSGTGVVLDNAANTATAIRIQDQFVTFEWMEVRNGSGSGTHCIDYVPSSANNYGVIRNNLIRNCSGQSIRLAGSGGTHVADVTNNIVYRGAREAIRVNVPLGTGTGSRVRIFNNTFYRNNGATAQPNTEISTAETPNPYVTLRNNIMVDDAQSPDSTWNGAALCTNATQCDWWNVASGNNITGDTLPAWPPVVNWRPDIGPNPRQQGVSAASEASVSFVNTGVGTENLHLMAGSAAWNRAATLTGVVAGDVDAQIRSGPWDIGADELPASAAPPLLVWSDVAATPPRHLRYTTFSGGVWAAGASAVPGPFSSGAPLFSKVARTHPNGTRRAAVASENDGAAGGAKLQVSFWDGTNWDNGTGAPFSDAHQLTTTLSTPIVSRHFDAAYEQASGDLVVVSGANTDDTVFIWVYNGAAWSGNLFITPGGNGQIGTNGEDPNNTFRVVRLEPRPGTNQIAFIGSATDGVSADSAVISAAIWNGDTNTFGSKQTLSLPVSGPDGSTPQNPHTTDAIDIDYVLGGANAGEALAVWGTQTQLWRRIWNSGSGWGANAMVQDLGGGNTLRWIRQKAASNGDDMILGIEDSSERIHTIRYDGNTRAFSAFQTHSTTANGNADLNRPFDVVWDLGTGANTVLIVYSDTAGIKYKVSGDGGATWTLEQTLTLAYQAHWVQLERDPSNLVHLVIKDQADDLRAWSWSAGSWTVTTPTLPSTSVETNGASQNVEAFAIATYPPLAVTTAVKLQSFDAVGRDAAVELAWKTASELDNQGFHLYRGGSPEGPWTRLTASLVPGLGSSPLGRSYSWRDSGLVNGQRYYYRLEDVDTRSKSTFHGPVSAVPSAPAASPGEAVEGRDKARKRRDDRSSPRNECPAWVLARYAEEVPEAAGESLACTKHGDPEALALDVVSRDARSVLYELRTGGFYAVREASGTVRAYVDGFSSPEDPKAPALPVRRALVDAVVGRKARLMGAAGHDVRSFTGMKPAATGEAEMAIRSDGTVRPTRRAGRPLRGAAGLVPRELVTLEGTVFQGETKSAVLELQPLRYDARSGRLVLASRIRFRLDFSARDPQEAGLGRRGRRRPPAPAPAPAASALVAELFASRTGIHAVAFEALFPQGGAPIAVSSLSLLRQQESVPFHVEPAGRDFGRGSVLYFNVASAAGSTWFSGEVAHQLLRGASGASMPPLAAPPQGGALASASRIVARFEADRFYQPGLLEAKDPWLWEALPSGAVRVKPFALAGVDAHSSLGARIVVELVGSTDAVETIEDHHVRVSVNGVDLGEAYFDGKRPFSLSAPLPASLLREGTNEVALANVGDTGVSSMVFLDRFTLEYPQTPRLQQGRFEGAWLESGAAELAGAAGPAVVLDVTDEAIGQVAWLTGAASAGGALRFEAQALRRYRAATAEGLLSPRVAIPEASSLRDASNQADYLLIAPRDFLAAAAPLVERRASQGLRARAVAFEEVVSVFGFGQPSAEAIREFLRHAYHSWARPSPRYVLLVGDSTYDPRNFTGVAQPSPLPALYVATSYLVTASDPALAAVNGEDGLPDLAIGRLPATTAADAEALVAKILAWEDSGQSLDGRALLVADNPDAAGDFEADIRDVAESFLGAREVQLAHVRELGAATRPTLLAAFDGGLSLASYVGHGGASVWASENVLNSWDAASLAPQSRQPLLVTMNCLNGYFVAPSYDALAEAFLKAPGRGAIAAFSPSGLSLDGPAHVLHRALVSELAGGGHARLGDAVLAAQKAYAEAGPMPELLGIYHLFGDPALTLGGARGAVSSP